MKPATLTLAFALAALAVPCAFAGGLGRDRVHSDSFGNLVIYSAAGYKRIIVGAGQAATGSNQQTKAPRVAYHGSQRLHLTRGRDCEFGAVLVHGRSYMYGLPEGVVPTPADVLCK